MAKSFQSPFVQTCDHLSAVISNTTGTGLVAAYTATTNDSVLKSFGVTNTDSSAYTLQVWVQIAGAGSQILIGSVAVAASAGFGTTNATVDVLRNLNMGPFFQLDAYGNRVLYLKAGTIISVGVTATVTSGKNIYCFGEVGDF